MIVASVGAIRDITFAARGRVLVAAIDRGNDHEILFCHLAHPDRALQRVPGRNLSWPLAVSSDGGLVASSTIGGQVQLFDPFRGKLIQTLHGYLNAVFGVAFSPDGRRWISTSGGREAAKLWDIATGQELLTLSGTGSALAARWSTDGDVFLLVHRGRSGARQPGRKLQRRRQRSERIPTGYESDWRRC
jgi:WD40 repeat protein